MQEVPEDSIKTLLSSKESLAACDIAVFVHDRYWKKNFIKLQSLFLIFTGCDITA